MNDVIPSRRKFFSSIAGVAAVPVAGISKALGMVPKPKTPEPFKDGGVLTAKGLNDQFDDIRRRLDEA